LGITQILPLPSCGRGENGKAVFPTGRPRARAIFGLCPRATPISYTYLKFVFAEIFWLIGPNFCIKTKKKRFEEFSKKAKFQR